MKAFLIFVVVVILSIIFFGGDEYEVVSCHNKAKITSIGQCNRDQGFSACAIGFKSHNNSIMQYGELESVGVVGQPIFQECFNRGEGPLCYTKLRKKLDKKYQNSCSSTIRYHNFDFDKPVLKSNLEKIHGWFIDDSP